MNLNTNSHTLPTASDLSTEKRSICLMNDSFPPVIDGVANAVTNYASVIQRSYGDATVVTPYYPDADDSIYPFPVLRYPSIDVTKLVGYRAGLPLSPELMAQVEGRHIDLIHSHCPVTSTILARMLRQRLHVPLVFTYHTKFDIDIANAIHSRLLQEASIKLLVENISACDEVWTVSRGAGENLRSLGYQGDYIVMPNGVDIPSDRLPEETVRAVSEGLDLPEGVPLLLFVGRMMWYKGLRIILDALKQLKGEGQDFRMVFIGKGTDGEAIRAYAEELCLGDKVFFLPPCYDREIIRAWYCRADLFLFPSTFDTNGLVVREAAACGLASVLIAGSCAAEDVTDGRNGFFIEENAASMAAMLRRLLPQRLVDALLPPESAGRKIAELSRAARQQICARIQDFRTVPAGLAGLKKAEACRGGVDTRQVDPYSLQSTVRENLWIVGELLDVTGLLGGYNLHWAWASGMAAGRALALFAGK